MKRLNDQIIIGVDHGYGNIKTANHCFKTGILGYDSEPLFTDQVIPTAIGQHVTGEERFRIISQDTGPKTVVCGFDVAIAMVNTDDKMVVQSFHFHSSLSF